MKLLHHVLARWPSSFASEKTSPDSFFAKNTRSPELQGTPLSVSGPPLPWGGRVAAAPRIREYEDIYKRAVVLRTHLKRFAPEMIPRQARYYVPLKHVLAC